MVKIKRKAVDEGQAVGVERTGKGIIAFPRYYVKSVSDCFSIYHRLTHAYLETVDSEDELLGAMTEYAEMTERELWEHLLGSRGFSINNILGINREKFLKDEEDWYLGAWGVFTTKFYDNHPELLQEVKEVPKGIINELRQEISARQLEEHKAHQERIEKAEKVNSVKIPTPPKVKVEKPEPEKQVSSIEEEQPKKLKKKVKIRIPKISLNF